MSEDNNFAHYGGALDINPGIRFKIDGNTATTQSGEKAP